jgi:hypothetical protein
MTRHEFLTKLATCRKCRRDRLAVAMIAGVLLLVNAV